MMIACHTHVSPLKCAIEWARACVQTHTYTHTHTHAHAHLCTHACTHVRRRARKRTQARLHAHAQAWHARTHTNKNTLVMRTHGTNESVHSHNFGATQNRREFPGPRWTSSPPRSSPRTSNTGSLRPCTRESITSSKVFRDLRWADWF